MKTVNGSLLAILNNCLAGSHFAILGNLATMARQGRACYGKVWHGMARRQEINRNKAVCFGRLVGVVLCALFSSFSFFFFGNMLFLILASFYY